MQVFSFPLFCVPFRVSTLISVSGMQTTQKNNQKIPTVFQVVFSQIAEVGV